MSLDDCRAELCEALVTVVPYDSVSDPAPTLADCNPESCTTYFADQAQISPSCPNGVITHMCVAGQLVCLGNGPTLKCGWVRRSRTVTMTNPSPGVFVFESPEGFRVRLTSPPDDINNVVTSAYTVRNTTADPSTNIRSTVQSLGDTCATPNLGCETRLAYRILLGGINNEHDVTVLINGNQSGPIGGVSVDPTGSWSGTAPYQFDGTGVGEMEAGIDFAGVGDEIDLEPTLTNGAADNLTVRVEMWEYRPAEVTCNAEGTPVSAIDCDGDPLDLNDVNFDPSNWDA